MVLMTLLPARLLPKVQPVAAADYFLRNKLVAWFALNISEMIGNVKNNFGESGAMAVLFGPLTGTSYKIYAAQAGYRRSKPVGVYVDFSACKADSFYLSYLIGSFSCEQGNEGISFIE